MKIFTRKYYLQIKKRRITAVTGDLGIWLNLQLVL